MLHFKYEKIQCQIILFQNCISSRKQQNGFPLFGKQFYFYFLIYFDKGWFVLSEDSIVGETIAFYHLADFLKTLAQTLRYVSVRSKGNDFAAEFRISFDYLLVRIDHVLRFILRGVAFDAAASRDQLLQYLVYDIAVF